MNYRFLPQSLLGLLGGSLCGVAALLSSSPGARSHFAFAGVILATVGVVFLISFLRNRGAAGSETKTETVSPAAPCTVDELERQVTEIDEEEVDLDFVVKRNDAMRRADNHLRTARRRQGDGDKAGAAAAVAEGLKVIQSYRELVAKGPPRDE